MNPYIKNKEVSVVDDVNVVCNLRSSGATISFHILYRNVHKYMSSFLYVWALSQSHQQSYPSFYFVGIPYRKVCMTKQMQAVNKFAITSKDYYHNVNITEGASAQFPIWIFNFWPYGQLRVRH